MTLISQLQLTRWLIALLILVASGHANALWPFGFYRFAAISGTVVDLETRKPIEGVVVVGHWGLMRQLVMSSSYVGPLVVQEAVTDKDGKFTLPASYATDIHRRGHYDASLFPVLAFFKSSYEFTFYRHNAKRPLMTNWPDIPRVDENVYSMRSVNSNSDSVEVRYESVRAGAGWFLLTSSSEKCNDFSQLTPKLLRALQDERTRVAKESIELSKWFSSSHYLLQMEICTADKKGKE